MNKITSGFKNKTLVQFVRVALLIALIVYIICRILYFLGFFIEEINCTAEQTITRNNKEYLVSDNGYRFDNANGRTNEKAMEGTYSVKLTPDNQFGMSMTFDIPKGGEEYEASVWCYEMVTSADTTGWPFLVVSVGNQFWKGVVEFSEKKDGWGKLHLKFTIPPARYKDPVVIYCWNSSKNVVYFDNMMIKRKNYWKFFRQDK